jgi:hypothetical protein
LLGNPIRGDFGRVAATQPWDRLSVRLSKPVIGARRHVLSRSRVAQQHQPCI